MWWFDKGKQREIWDDEVQWPIGDIEAAHKIRNICRSALDSAEQAGRVAEDDKNDNNNSGGITLGENSTLETSGWNGQPVDISNNRGPGVYVSFGSLNTYGRTTIMNNVAGQGSLSG